MLGEELGCTRRCGIVQERRTAVLTSIIIQWELRPYAGQLMQSNVILFDQCQGGSFDKVAVSQLGTRQELATPIKALNL